MLFTKITGYALSALSALPEDGTYRSAAELADDLDLPPSYLSKILSTLANKGLLLSVRGPHGGFRLARPARRITVADVVGAVTEGGDRGPCLLGSGACDHEHPCTLHRALGVPVNRLVQALDRMTLADLREHGRLGRNTRLATANLRSRIA